MGDTKQLFPRFIKFLIPENHETLVAYWISDIYLVDITTAWLTWHLLNMWFEGQKGLFGTTDISSTAKLAIIPPSWLCPVFEKFRISNCCAIIIIEIFSGPYQNMDGSMKGNCSGVSDMWPVVLQLSQSAVIAVSMVWSIQVISWKVTLRF